MGAFDPFVVELPYDLVPSTKELKLVAFEKLEDPSEVPCDEEDPLQTADAFLGHFRNLASEDVVA